MRTSPRGRWAEQFQLSVYMPPTIPSILIRIRCTVLHDHLMAPKPSWLNLTNLRIHLSGSSLERQDCEPLYFCDVAFNSRLQFRDHEELILPIREET